MLVVAAVLLLPWRLPAQCDLTAVEAAVVIDSQRLLLKFSLEGRNRVARDAARELALRGREIFPFFCWTAADGRTPGQQAARLIAHVTDGQGSRNGAVVLRYRFAAGERSEDLCGVGKIPEVVLYPNKHPGPDAHSKQLFDDLAAAFQHLGNDGTPAILERLFASKIHLGSEVEVDEKERSILVLLDEARMGAGERTELRLDFTSNPDEGDSLIFVSKNSPCRPKKRKVFSTAVSRVKVPLRPEAQGWVAEIPGWLNEAMRRGSLAIFLEHLVPGSCTEVRPGLTVPPPEPATSCPGCVSPR